MTADQHAPAELGAVGASDVAHAQRRTEAHLGVLPRYRSMQHLHVAVIAAADHEPIARLERDDDAPAFPEHDQARAWCRYVVPEVGASLVTDRALTHSEHHSPRPDALRLDPHRSR